MHETLRSMSEYNISIFSSLSTLKDIFQAMALQNAYNIKLWLRRCLGKWMN
jgi:hypothetical protein